MAMRYTLCVRCVALEARLYTLLCRGLSALPAVNVLDWTAKPVSSLYIKGSTNAPIHPLVVSAVNQSELLNWPQ